MKKLTLLTVLLTSALAACGCVPSGGFTAPDAYVMLPHPGGFYDKEAVSADGVYFGLRTPQPSEDGTLAFWSTAIRNQLINARGYILAGEADAGSADGTPGKRLDFTATLAGREMGYFVAVWVVGKEVHVAEAGGPKDKFDTDRAKLEAALATVRLK
jgi:hypothetical protein